MWYSLDTPYVKQPLLALYNIDCLYLGDLFEENGLPKHDFAVSLPVAPNVLYALPAIQVDRFATQCLFTQL